MAETASELKSNLLSIINSFGITNIVSKYFIANWLKSEYSPFHSIQKRCWKTERIIFFVYWFIDFSGENSPQFAHTSTVEWVNNIDRYEFELKSCFQNYRLLLCSHF